MFCDDKIGAGEMREAERAMRLFRHISEGFFVATAEIAWHQMLMPALMVMMGIIVGFIAVSIITPIYGITQNLHA